MERWLKVFKQTAKKPRIWGLHNYRDTNKRKGQRLGGTKRLLKAVKGEVWLTETGGIVKFVLPNGHTLFRAQREPGRTARPSGCSSWPSATAAGSSGSTSTTGSSPRDPNNRFDAGLMSRSTARRARPYTTVRQLATRLQPVGEWTPAASGSGGRGCTSSPMCGRASRSCSRRRSPAGWTWSSSATSRRAMTSSRARPPCSGRPVRRARRALLAERPARPGGGVRRRRRARRAGRHAGGEARQAAGGEVLVGLSTHSPAQLDAALAAGEADQLSVGPVWETPTKEGRPAAGLDYVRYAAEVAGRPPLVRDRRDRPR